MLLTSETEALRAFDKIVSAYPEHRYSRRSRAKLLINAGRAGDAIADLDVLLAEDSRDPNLLALRGNANIRAGNARQAVTDLTEALKQDPGRYDSAERPGYRKRNPWRRQGGAG